MSELLVPVLINLGLGLLLVVLFYAFRPKEPPCLSGPEEAEKLFRGHFPDDSSIPLSGATLSSAALSSTTLTSDRRGALIPLHPGVGILVGHGSRWNARRILARDMRSARLEGDELVLKFADFGWPTTRLALAPGAVRAEWLERLRSLTAERAIQS